MITFEKLGVHRERINETILRGKNGLKLGGEGKFNYKLNKINLFVKNNRELHLCYSKFV